MNESRRPAWKKIEKTNNNVLRPLEVDVRNGDLEEAIKILRHKMSKDGILAELKTRRHAEKPSDKKRREHREAIKKMRRSRGKKARVSRTQSRSDK